MQPLKPEERDRIRREHPQAAPEDVERYEKLLSERFTVDPDRPQPAPERRGGRIVRSLEDIEQELRQLYTRIFEHRSGAPSRSSSR